MAGRLHNFIDDALMRLLIFHGANPSLEHQLRCVAELVKLKGYCHPNEDVATMASLTMK